MRTTRIPNRLILALVVCVAGAILCNSAFGAGQQAKTLNKQITKQVGCKYLIALPKGYDQGDKEWPLMLFLHGAGERGDDLNKVKVHGPPKLVEQGKELPFIVVSPQCPTNVWWPEKLDTLTTLLDEIEANYRVDKDRIYLTGLSMGGFGTWSLACHQPERFAAIAPVCGGGQWFLANRLKDVPVWAFHGGKDSVVPIELSQKMVEAVKRAGGDAKLTVYPEAGHDSWTESYNNPKLYDWFLSHSKGKAVEQEKKKFSQGSMEIEYLFALPQGYSDNGKSWPLMLFLHGAGERGDNVEKVKVHGPPKLIDRGKSLPFIVVSPQCPRRSSWSSQDQIQVLIALLDDIVANYNVDESRVYLTGLSMGGYGTWAMGATCPERFAALVPICGGGRPSTAEKLKNTPIWVFHGARDNVVPIQRSKDMVQAVKAAGGDVQLTIYPEATHDSWTATYDNPKLYDWLLSHRLNKDN